MQGNVGGQGIQGLSGAASSQGMQGVQGIQGSQINLLSITSSIIPNSNVAYDLGSPTLAFRDLYLSGNTLNIGNSSISATGNTISLPAGSTLGGVNPATVYLLGNVNAVANLPVSPTPNIGDAYVVTEFNPAQLYTYTGGGYTSLGNFQGPQGFQGLQGRQGLQGTSQSGSQGLQGLQGSLGSQGLQGTSQSGSQGLQGRQGLQGTSQSGSQGLQGLQGSLGSQGLQGPAGGGGGGSGSSIVNGTSNVNIANSNGNVTISVGGTSNVMTIASSNITVAGGVVVSNTVSAQGFISNAAGTPTIASDTDIRLVANGAVIVTETPFRIASMTTQQRDTFTAAIGDIIFNTTTTKFQGYTGVSWVDFH